MTGVVNNVTVTNSEGNTGVVTVNGTRVKAGGEPVVTYTYVYFPTVTVQKPTIETDANATVTLNSTGTTATITVADGYELADVIVNGVSKGAVTTLTGLKTGDKVVVTTKKTEEPPVVDDSARIKADRKSTRLNSSHSRASRMPSSA